MLSDYRYSFYGATQVPTESSVYLTVYDSDLFEVNDYFYRCNMSGCSDLDYDRQSDCEELSKIFSNDVSSLSWTILLSVGGAVAGVIVISSIVVACVLIRKKRVENRAEEVDVATKS
jgi:hypothetical protein